MTSCNDLLAAGADQLPARCWHGCGAVCSFCAGADPVGNAPPVFVVTMARPSKGVCDLMQKRRMEFFGIVGRQQMFRNGKIERTQGVFDPRFKVKAQPP